MMGRVDMSQEERIARVICEAEGVDPDHICVDVGAVIPAGERWPAWKACLHTAKAVLAEIIGE
jgi:hypothetical protein